MKCFLCSMGLFSLLVFGHAQGTAFTYQGYLRDGGLPSNGNHDFQFSLWTTASGGTHVGTAQTLTSVAVQSGLFTVSMDFGTEWSGADRFLQIAVRPAGSGSYTTLSPRVKINPTPYAVYAAQAGTANPVGAAGGDLSGTHPNPTVVGLQTRTVASTVPTSGQILKWAGTMWAPAADDGMTLPFSGSANMGAGAVFSITNKATSGLPYGVWGYRDTPAGFGGYFQSAGCAGARIAGSTERFQNDSTSGGRSGLETSDIVRATNYTNRSDERLMPDIQPLDAMSDFQRLLSLRPVSYYWRDERMCQKQQHCFTVQAQGSDEQKTLTVNYHDLFPMLVNALKVQEKRILQQETRIQRLQHPKRITILYDAFGPPSELKKDWGFAALVEYGGKRILFDTGNDAGLFEHNVQKLGVDLKRLDAVVISHRHGDHTSGLSYLLKVNPEVMIYVPMEPGFFKAALPKSFLAPVPSLPSDLRYYEGNYPEYVATGTPWEKANFSVVRQTKEIFPGFFVITTQSQKPGTIEMNEVSLLIRTEQGLVVVVGCSHSGVEQILTDAAKIDSRLYSVFGGFHLVLTPEEEVKRVADVLHDTLRVQRVAPGHCTSELGFAVFLEKFGSRYDKAGLGTAIPLP